MTKTAIRDFRDKYLQITVDNYFTVLFLSKKSETHEKSLQLANAWAEKIAVFSKPIFSSINSEITKEFEIQANIFKQDMQVAEQTLSDFDSQHSISIWQNDLASLQTQPAKWFHIQFLIEDTTRNLSEIIAFVKWQKMTHRPHLTYTTIPWFYS